MSLIIRNCQVADIEGATHQVMLDKPQEFLAAVRAFQGDIYVLT